MKGFLLKQIDNLSQLSVMIHYSRVVNKAVKWKAEVLKSLIIRELQIIVKLSLLYILNISQ